MAAEDASVNITGSCPAGFENYFVELAAAVAAAGARDRDLAIVLGSQPGKPLTLRRSVTYRVNGEAFNRTTDRSGGPTPGVG